jgi:hypothetical protein
MTLVDSSVWVDYFNDRRTRQTDWVDARLGVEEFAIGDLILCEVLQGFNDPRELQETKRLLDRIPVLELGGKDVAIAAAENYQALRHRGITVRKTIDTILATYCIAKGHELLHADRDFEPFERHLGLRVIRP